VHGDSMNRTRKKPTPKPRPRKRREKRTLLAWSLAFLTLVAGVAWLAASPGYKNLGGAIAVVGLGITAALALAGWPRTKEFGRLAALISMAIGAIGAAAAVAVVGGGDQSKTGSSAIVHPPPAHARADLPSSGPTLRVWNKVTNGAKQMRDDAEHPAYLSSVPRDFCKKFHCALSGTDLLTGDTVGPAVCRKTGEYSTNGDGASSLDDHNPGLFSSRTWYGIRRHDNTIAYISVVWVAPAQRGLRLPEC
jgi:hypothetical protein